jgi:hypothetical protein
VVTSLADIDIRPILRRLERSLELPGRLDELITFLKLEPKYLPHGAAPASLARLIYIQMELRIPPGIDDLIRAIGLSPEELAAPMSPRPSERPMTVLEGVATIRREALCGALFAMILLAVLAWVFRQGALGLVLGAVAGSVFVATVFLCLKSFLADHPHSIVEAQLAAEARQLRWDYNHPSRFSPTRRGLE